jgi:endoglycosylceramidase
VQRAGGEVKARDAARTEHRALRSACVAAALALTLTLTPVAAAASAQLPLLSHQGRWLTDPEGRVVVLHGLQVDRFEPTAPVNFVDLAPANAAFMAAEGFNLARVSMSYGGVEPSLGHFDQAYIDSYVGLDRELAQAGLWDLLDLQQGQFGPAVDGNGFPAWMTATDGLPNPPEAFPLGYFGNPAQNRAWDNFWSDAPAADGVGLQAHYLAGLRRLATTFAVAPGLVGFDVLNEPWPGSVWPTCANPVGCPPGGFDQTQLTAFYQRLLPALRAVDPRHLFFYEPNLLFNSGAVTNLGPIGDRNAVLTFHNYCLGDEPGLPQSDPGGDCGLEEQMVLANADALAQRTGDGLLMDEWGNNPTSSLVQRIAAEADQHMVGWGYWAYEDCCNSPGAVVADGSKPPDAPGNLNRPLLMALVRPYPQAIAGTPTAWGYTPDGRVFRLSYSTRRAGGGGFKPGTQTRIEVPALHYPTGYDVTVSGARVSSAPDADPLLLDAVPGAADITVTVVPADHHPPGLSSVGSTSGSTAAAVAIDCPASHARLVTVHAHGQRGRVVSVAVYVDGRRVSLRRGHDVRRVALPGGLPNGAVIRVVATTARGARVVSTRSVRDCRLTAPRTKVYRRSVAGVRNSRGPRRRSAAVRSAAP